MTGAVQGSTPPQPTPGPRHAGPSSLPRIAGVLLGAAVLPGTGHLATGHRRSGRLILGVALLLLAVLVAGLVVALVSPATAAGVAVRPGWLRALQVGVPLLALAWIAVIVRTAVLTRPGSRGVAGRLVASVVTLLLVAVVAVPAGVVARYAAVQHDLLDDVFGRRVGGDERERVARLGARLNVLLVGSDAGPDRRGTRTDTVILASVDTRTGRTVLFSLPRNLEQVPFTPGSVMAEQWPDGFDCGDVCLLNAVYGWAVEHPDLFPGDPDPGMTALRSAVTATLGLPIDFYALVDLTGFPALIDALGGVTIRVERDLPIGGLDPRGKRVPPSGYVRAGLQRMDGETALQYARSRRDSSDYERVQRQRCLLGAVQREVEPRNLLANFAALASTTARTVRTDIPGDLLPTLVELAFSVKEQPIESLTFTPPLIDVVEPDFVAVRAAVDRALVAAPPASASPPATPPPRLPPAVPPVPSASPSPGTTSGSAPVPVDQVCAYE